MVGKREVEINEGKSRLNLCCSFVVKAGQLEVARVEVEICQVIVGLDMTRIAFQRKCEVVERFAKLSLFEINYAQVAMSLSYVVTFTDRFEIVLRSHWITLLMQQ